MEKFSKEIDPAEVHQRDHWQFELKSDFFTHPNLKKNTYIQEFYFFIPKSLQVNEESYSKQQFYLDETIFIRYKTPEFTLEELLDKDNVKSPFVRLTNLCASIPSKENIPIVQDELKLLGNIVRSSLRENVLKLVKSIDIVENTQEASLLSDVKKLCAEISKLHSLYFEIQMDFSDKWKNTNQMSHFIYVDEFISEIINFYLIGLLDGVLRSNLNNKMLISEEIYDLLAKEKLHRETFLPKLRVINEDPKSREYILYRSGILNKFVLDALLLHTTRSSVTTRFRNIIGSIAAGIAMLFFFVLFVKQGSVLVLNSLPFVLLTVLLYILKDRMKEWLQVLSYRQFAKWFSDYKTEIFSPDGKTRLGTMWQYVSFVEEKELSKDLLHIRNREFHAVLESFKRPENVLYYKRKISLQQNAKPLDSRRNALNIISRYNVTKFLSKADNPSQDYITVDPQTREFDHTRLAKVYHLNVIQRNTYEKADGSLKIELKKFRLILDKNGIKRIEVISEQ